METSISVIIKKRRKALGLTLAQLADMVGVSEATVQRWESGNIKSLRYKNQLAIAEALKLKPTDLVPWLETPQPADPKTDGLREKLVEMLMSLTPDETRQVIAFVKGLTASRKDPPAPEE